MLALKINKELRKDKILELYLNKIYFGNHAYGIAAAAQVYYGKSLNQLTLSQMAMIAGLPQAPSRNNPLDNAKAALDRRNHVLKRMLEVGFIAKEQYAKAIKAPITAKYHPEPVVQAQAPYVAEMVREAVVDKYGKDTYDRGLSVYTTISSTLQQEGNHLRNGLIAYDERHGYRKPQENLSVFSRETWLSTLKQKKSLDGILPAAVITVSFRSIQVLAANGNTITVPWSGLSWARPALNDGDAGFPPIKASDIVKRGDVVDVMQSMNGGQWWLNQTSSDRRCISCDGSANGCYISA